jgi:hypothetical protein
MAFNLNILSVSSRKTSLSFMDEKSCFYMQNIYFDKELPNAIFSLRTHFKNSYCDSLREKRAEQCELCCAIYDEFY